MDRSSSREPTSAFGLSSEVWPSDSEGDRVAVNRELSSMRIAIKLVIALTDRACSDLTSSINKAASEGLPRTGGGYSRVHRGVLFNGKKVAIKRLTDIPPGEEDNRNKLKRAARELYTWSKLQHRNVLPLLGLMVYEGCLALVSEWMDNGDLSDYLRRNPEADRIKFCIDIGAGLNHIHEIGIVHGDLRAGNVMVSSSGRAMISDFGSALMQRTLKSRFSVSPAVTPRWAAPEVMTGESWVTQKSDVYSYGLTVLEVLTEKLPYGSTREFSLARLFQGRPVPPYEPVLDNEATRMLSDIARACWNWDPARRPTMETVRDRLRALARASTSGKEDSEAPRKCTCNKCRSIASQSRKSEERTPFRASPGRPASVDLLSSIGDRFSNMKLNSSPERKPLRDSTNIVSSNARSRQDRQPKPEPAIREYFQPSMPKSPRGGTSTRDTVSRQSPTRLSPPQSQTIFRATVSIQRRPGIPITLYMEQSDMSGISRERQGKAEDEERRSGSRLDRYPYEEDEEEAGVERHLDEESGNGLDPEASESASEDEGQEVDQRRNQREDRESSEESSGEDYEESDEDEDDEELGEELGSDSDSESSESASEDEGQEVDLRGVWREREDLAVSEESTDEDDEEFDEDEDDEGDKDWIDADSGEEEEALNWALRRLAAALGRNYRI